MTHLFLVQYYKATNYVTRDDLGVVEGRHLASKEDVDKCRVDLVSRHKHHYQPPETPPGFWDVDFPPTQEARRSKNKVFDS
jgi:hypothetical protein